MLMASDRPLTEFRIAELLGLSGKGSSKKVVAALEELNAHYAESGRAFRAERLAGGWQMLTLPAFGPILHRLHDDRQQSRLSQPALETLAIIAYRQPIMRAEIEAIRGVASGEVLRSLLERRLVKIVGRAEELGRPMLYGTTREFLKVFGLAAIDDLPAVKGLLPSQAAPANRAMTPVDEAEPSAQLNKDALTDDSASAASE
jgi:segregation and condensation protein B